VWSQILGKVLKTKALRACRPPARSRAPPTGYAKKVRKGIPGDRSAGAASGVRYTARVRTPAVLGTHPRLALDAKLRLVVPGPRRRADQTKALCSVSENTAFFCTCFELLESKTLVKFQIFTQDLVVSCFVYKKQVSPCRVARSEGNYYAQVNPSFRPGWRHPFLRLTRFNCRIATLRQGTPDFGLHNATNT